MAEFECTCTVIKGEREIAYGEDCYCWYPKPNYNEKVYRCKDCNNSRKRKELKDIDGDVIMEDCLSCDVLSEPKLGFVRKVKPDFFCGFSEPKAVG